MVGDRSHWAPKGGCLDQEGLGRQVVRKANAWAGSLVQLQKDGSADISSAVVIQGTNLGAPGAQ